MIHIIYQQILISQNHSELRHTLRYFSMFNAKSKKYCTLCQVSSDRAHFVGFPRLFHTARRRTFRVRSIRAPIILQGRLYAPRNFAFPQIRHLAHRHASQPGLYIDINTDTGKIQITIILDMDNDDIPNGWNLFITSPPKGAAEYFQ